MSFFRLFDGDNVLLDLEQTTKEEALAEMVDHLAGIGRLKKGQARSLLESILQREQQGSTGIGKGVALPHAKHSGLKELVPLFARSTKGIDFEAPDHKPVKIFFLVLSPEDKPEEHIKFLRWLSTLAREADFRSFVGQAGSVKELQGLLQEFGGEE